MLSNILDFTLWFDDFFLSRMIQFIISSHARRFTKETLTGKDVTISRVTSQVISRVIPSRISHYDFTSYSHNCNQQSCKAFHGGNTEVTGKLERYFTLRFHELFLPQYHLTISRVIRTISNQQSCKAFHGGNTDW